ncbi:MAG: DoxX family protein [Candidatus Levyibacteriota bacterium]
MRNNVVLWVLQVLLAFWNIFGGVYLLMNYKLVAAPWTHSLPKIMWPVLGTVQILLAVGLVLPGLKFRRVNVISSIGIAALYLFAILLYTPYSGFPGMLWGLIPAVIAGWIVYGRRQKSS